ncbi:tail fibers protein [Escherichia phage EC147]|nr:tail fibers protein [Escherichia phage EC147]
MAIYRTGQASMDAQGYITGYDTKWREQLTLIRPGATIFFIDAPFQAAVISEVISDTQIRAITTGGAEIGRSNYIILLHDSITVDGLAQDVAETLRYYQSKETQIEEAIEFFKNFDLKQLQDLANQVKADTNAIKEQKAKVDKQQEEIETLKSEIADLKEAVAALLDKPTTLES